MSNRTIELVVDLLQKLPEERRQKVLSYARDLEGEAPRGVPGSSLLASAGAIHPDDLEQMSRAIEQGCE